MQEFIGVAGGGLDSGQWTQHVYTICYDIHHVTIANCCLKILFPITFYFSILWMSLSPQKKKERSSIGRQERSDVYIFRLHDPHCSSSHLNRDPDLTNAASHQAGRREVKPLKSGRGGRESGRAERKDQGERKKRNQRCRHSVPKAR